MLIKSTDGIRIFLEKHILNLEDKELEEKILEIKKKQNFIGLIIDPLEKTSIFPNIESEKSFELEKEYENKQNRYLETLTTEEKIILMSLMYLGRDNFISQIDLKILKKYYNIYYNQFFNDSYFNSQMTGKGNFIYYLRQAISKIY